MCAIIALMFGQDKRTVMAATIGTAVEQIGSASKAVAAIVALAALALLLSGIAIVIAVKSR